MLEGRGLITLHNTTVPSGMLLSLQEYVSQNQTWCWYYESMNLIYINLYFWLRIIKGEKYIVILMAKFLFS